MWKMAQQYDVEEWERVKPDKDEVRKEVMIAEKMKVLKKHRNECQDKYEVLRKLFVDDKKGIEELINSLPTKFLLRLTKKKFKAYEDLFGPMLFKGWKAEDDEQFKKQLMFDSEILRSTKPEIVEDPLTQLLKQHKGGFRSNLVSMHAS